MQRYFIMAILWLCSFSCFALDPSHWIVQESSGRVSHSTAKQIASSVKKHANKHNLDPNLVLRIMHVESRFDPKAKSWHGAIGLMQIIPKYHKDLIRGRSLFNIETNIEVGVQILAGYKLQHRTMYRALQAYNGSQGSSRYPNKISKVRTAHLIWKEQQDSILPIVNQEDVELLMSFHTERPI